MRPWWWCPVSDELSCSHSHGGKVPAGRKCTTEADWFRAHPPPLPATWQTVPLLRLSGRASAAFLRRDTDCHPPQEGRGSASQQEPPLSLHCDQSDTMRRPSVSATLSLRILPEFTTTMTRPERKIGHGLRDAPNQFPLPLMKEIASLQTTVLHDGNYRQPQFSARR